MKFKLIYIFVFLSFSLNLVLANNSAPSNINNFIDHLNQKASVQNQKNKANLNEFNTTVNQLQSKKPPVDKLSSTFQKANNSNNTPTINCNNQNDGYNYPSNYVYDENHQKIYRRRPFAKCIQTTPTEQQPVAIKQNATALPTADNNNKNLRDSQTTSTQWDINY